MAAMVDELEPDELDKWLALAVVDGWGEEWRMAGMIAATIHNSALRIVSAIPMCASPVKRTEIRTDEDFMPKHSRPVKPPKPKAGDNNPVNTDELAKRLAGWK